jgi:hypothetical protein
VQLHLSRDCNRPELAAQSARAALLDSASPAQLCTASQEQPGPTLILDAPLDGCFSSLEPHAPFAFT